MSPRGRNTQQEQTVCTWRCDRPTRDGALVCETCLDEFAADLRELLPVLGDRPEVVFTVRVAGDTEWCPFPRPMVVVPGLWDELQSTIIAERGIDYSTIGGGGGSGERGVVSVGITLNENASDIAEVLRLWLKHLVRLCQEFRLEHHAPADWRPRVTVIRRRPMRWWPPEMAEGLLWWVDAMAWNPEVADTAAAVHQLIDKARWVVDRPSTRQQLGDCPADGCDGHLSAVQGATFATCYRCRAQVEAQPLRDRLLDELGDRLCTATDIAKLSTYLGLRAGRVQVRDRVYQWAHRERIEQRGTSEDGSPTYRFGEVYALLLETEAKAEARTSKPAPPTHTTKGA